MIEQIKNPTIPLFERRYPGHQAVFFFFFFVGNATYIHTIPPMQRTLSMQSGLSSGLAVDDLVCDLGSIRRPSSRNRCKTPRGVPKGTEKILEELGLWRPRLPVQCRIDNPKAGCGREDEVRQ